MGCGAEEEGPWASLSLAWSNSVHPACSSLSAGLESDTWSSNNSCGDTSCWALHSENRSRSILRIRQRSAPRHDCHEYDTLDITGVDIMPVDIIAFQIQPLNCSRQSSVRSIGFSSRQTRSLPGHMRLCQRRSVQDMECSFLKPGHLASCINSCLSKTSNRDPKDTSGRRWQVR